MRNEKRDQELRSLMPPGMENWEPSAEAREAYERYMDEELEEDEEHVRQMLEEEEEEWMRRVFPPPPEQS
jgi:glucosamine 6-phosphate synthetase-like amidotransferase/phosphosugar isomerase protein